MLAAVVAATSLGGWGVWAWISAAPQTVQVPAAAITQDGAGATPASSGTPVAEGGHAGFSAADAPSPVAPPQAPAAASAARPSQITLDLCGVGPVPVRLPPPGAADPSFELLPRPLGQHARAEAWARVLDAMDASPTERNRAAALVLRASGLFEAETSPLVQAMPDTTPFVRQLAALAQGTRDAGVLQWALAVCERTPRLAECQALSVRELVVLAPEDGRNWLLLAAADAAGRDEALRRAASAPVIAAMPSLTPAIEAAAAADLPPYLLQDLLVHAVGVEAAQVNSRLFSALRHCREATGERRGTCLALADALQLRGPELTELGVAAGLGKRLGWSPDRVAAAKAEQLSLMAQIPRFDMDQPYGCANVERTRDWLRERATLGERATLQRRAAAAASAPTR